MTSHELARKLLSKPDQVVAVGVGNAMYMVDNISHNGQMLLVHAKAGPIITSTKIGTDVRIIGVEFPRGWTDTAVTEWCLANQSNLSDVWKPLLIDCGTLPIPKKAARYADVITNHLRSHKGCRTFYFNVTVTPK